MDLTLRILLLITIFIYFTIIIVLLKRGLLLLKYTLLWTFIGLIMTLMIIFPGVLEFFLHLIGIVELTNGLFATVLFGLILIMISITSIVSVHAGQFRKVVQENAMYEERIRRLEELLKSDNSEDNDKSQ